MQVIEPYLELFGLILLAIAGIFFIITSVGLFASWKRKKVRETLIFAVGFLFASMGIIGLAIEKFLFAYYLSTPLGEPLGRLSGIIAISVSIGALICVNAFALLMTYEEHLKKALPLISILAIIPCVILCVAIGTGVATIVNGEFNYPIYITIVMAAMVLPVLLNPSMTFFYYAFKIRKKSKPHYLRTLTMGIALAVLAISFIVELAGASLIMAIIMRGGFFAFAILMYNALILPDWYKRMIKWSEE